MKRKKAVYVLLVLFAVLALMPMKADAAWKTKNGETFYYNTKGRKVKGWLIYQGKKYYLNEKGVLQTGWQQIDGHYYYFSKGRKQYGAALKGYQTLGKKDSIFQRRTAV